MPIIAVIQFHDESIMRKPPHTRRLEGRLFAEAGTLFLVLEVSDTAGTARVSCCLEGERQIIDMPLVDVMTRVGTAGALQLDNINAPETIQRISLRDDGWYFAAREGRIGPYATKHDAAQNLGRYILAMQTQPPQAVRAPQAKQVAQRKSVKENPVTSRRRRTDHTTPVAMAS